MIEEFDAATRSNQLATLTLIAGYVLISLLIEFALLFPLRRRARARGWLALEVLTVALSGQALFWGAALGTLELLPRLPIDTRLADLIRLGLTLAMLLALTILVVRLITTWVRLYLRNESFGSVSLINNVVRFLGVVAVLATALAIIGVPIGPLLTVVAGSSLGLTLALRDPLANLFAGLVTIASNKIRLGDYVRLSSGEEGYITDIRWSDTYIRQLTNNLIVVPNALITGTIVLNYNRPEPELNVLVEMAVSYDNDLAHVEQVTVDVAQDVLAEVSGGVPDFIPLVRFHSWSPSAVGFTVIIRGREFVDQYLLKHELIKRLRERYAAEQIALPLPVQTLRTTAPLAVALAGRDDAGGQGAGAREGQGARDTGEHTIPPA